MLDLENFKRKYRRFRYLYFPKLKLVLSFGKILISGIITICTIVMTAISIYIAKQSLDIAKQSLMIATQAEEISDLALKTSSSNTEPIFIVDVDDKIDKLSIKHETHNMYKIKYVTFGKVRTVAIMKYDSSDISAIEVEEKYGEKPLIEGRSANVGGCSEEEAREYNKELEISLDLDYMNEKALLIDQMEEEIQKECEKNENVEYWGGSPDFNYYYVEVVYSDAHGNLGSVYYIYKKEYMTDWKTYKITREEYKRYTKDVLSEYHGWKKEDKKIINKLFRDKNFKKFKVSKYDEYWHWFNLRQFE